MRGRMGRFLRRRLADAALAVAWVLAVFQLVQMRGVQRESTTEIVLTVVIALALGLAATLLWLRSRRRDLRERSREERAGGRAGSARRSR